MNDSRYHFLMGLGCGLATGSLMVAAAPPWLAVVVYFGGAILIAVAVGNLDMGKPCVHRCAPTRVKLKGTYTIRPAWTPKDQENWRV